MWPFFNTNINFFHSDNDLSVFFFSFTRVSTQFLNLNCSTVVHLISFLFGSLGLKFQCNILHHLYNSPDWRIVISFVLGSLNYKIDEVMSWSETNEMIFNGLWFESFFRLLCLSPSEFVFVQRWSQDVIQKYMNDSARGIDEWMKDKFFDFFFDLTRLTTTVLSSFDFSKIGRVLVSQIFL